GQVRAVLERVWTGPEGRGRRGFRQPREDRQAPALLLDPRRSRGAERLALRLRLADEARAGQDLLRDRRDLPRRAEQPPAGDLQETRDRGAAALRARRRVARRQPCRPRGQGTRVGGEGRARPLGAADRGGEAGGGEAGGRAPRPGRAAQGRARRPGQGRARQHAPHAVALVPGCRRARHGRQPRAHTQSGGTEGARGQADPRDQSRAPDGEAPGGREGALRRLGEPAFRPGAARRGRPARRPRGLRAPDERAHARDGRRGSPHHCPGTVEPLDRSGARLRTLEKASTASSAAREAAVWGESVAALLRKLLIAPEYPGDPEKTALARIFNISALVLLAA